MNYPTSLDNGTSLPNPSGTDKQNSPDHAGLHTSENQAIIALEGKVGTGASTPTANTIMFGTGVGTSAWTQLTSAQLAASLTDETGTGSVVFANTPTLVTPKVDTINESTPANGVTIDGLNIKDSAINTASAVGTAAIATGIQIVDKMKNPYKFRAYLTGAQTLTAGAYTRLLCDTKSYDTGSNVDVTTTKGRFTAPIAGYYHFNGLAQIAASGTTHFTIALYKNGAVHSTGSSIATTAEVNTINSAVNVSDEISLAANDTVDLMVYCNGAVALNVATPAAFNYFSGFLVSNT